MRMPLGQAALRVRFSRSAHGVASAINCTTQEYGQERNMTRGKVFSNDAIEFQKTKARQSRAFDEYLFLSVHFASLAI
jgi:hypothetical protein